MTLRTMIIMIPLAALAPPCFTFSTHHRLLVGDVCEESDRLTGWKRTALIGLDAEEIAGSFCVLGRKRTVLGTLLSRIMDGFVTFQRLV